MPALLPLPAELLYTTSRMSRPASSCARALPRASSAGSAEAASPDSAWQYTEPTRPRCGASVAGASRSPATTWQHAAQHSGSTQTAGHTQRQRQAALQGTGTGRRCSLPTALRLQANAAQVWQRCSVQLLSTMLKHSCCRQSMQCACTPAQCALRTSMPCCATACDAALLGLRLTAISCDGCRPPESRPDRAHLRACEGVRAGTAQCACMRRHAGAPLQDAYMGVAPAAHTAGALQYCAPDFAAIPTHVP
jgi:hypothetical protein